MPKLISIATMSAVAALLFTLSAVHFSTGLSHAAGGIIESWSPADLQILASMRIAALPAAPKDPSNLVENLPLAAQLGKRIFSDQRFSNNGAVSCASCHDPQKQFQDGLALGMGIGTGARRTMPLADLGHNAWYFWDGRKDSLWSQALGPLEDSAEHGGNRLAYAHLIQAYYQSDYEAVFGAMPDLGKLPKNAGPNGTPSEQSAWDAIDLMTQNKISRIFANMGKAIAAYERTIRYSESRFDRYVDALLKQESATTQTLKPQEINGLKIYIGKGECITCHGGPLLTDHYFHNTGVPLRDVAKLDEGRFSGLSKVVSDEFNCLGPFSDANASTTDHCQELRFMEKDGIRMAGAFKTPSLRNVALRPPYMHAGQIATLEEVVRHYIKAPKATIGHSELKPIHLSDKEVSDLVAFLGSVSGPIIEMPLISNTDNAHKSSR